MTGNDVCDGRRGGRQSRLKGGGLFGCLIDSVVFREANVSRDPDEGDLGAD